MNFQENNEFAITSDELHDAIQKNEQLLLFDLRSQEQYKSGHIEGSVHAVCDASTVLITLVAGARILYGMAKDGSLSSVLARIHPKTGTPWVAVICIFVTSVAFAFVGDIL